MAISNRSLMTYSPDLKILDCTLRDGGLVNNFAFSDEFVKDLYTANIASGVDYMEFGYKASKEIFDVNKFGKWKFCDEADIRAIVGDNKTDMKIAVMADVGRTDFKKDILPKSESVIDMIRVATYINTIPAAIEMIEDAHEKGYDTQPAMAVRVIRFIRVMVAPRIMPGRPSRKYTRTIISNGLEPID